MKSLLQNKILCWVALLLTVIYMVITFTCKAMLGWWSFCDVFFIFMAIFAHLCALYLSRLNPYASRTLDLFAFILLLLFVVAFIVEWVVYACAF